MSAAEECKALDFIDLGIPDGRVGGRGQTLLLGFPYWNLTPCRNLRGQGLLGIPVWSDFVYSLTFPARLSDSAFPMRVVSDFGELPCFAMFGGSEEVNSSVEGCYDRTRKDAHEEEHCPDCCESVGG